MQYGIHGEAVQRAGRGNNVFDLRSLAILPTMPYVRGSLFMQVSRGTVSRSPLVSRKSLLCVMAVSTGRHISFSLTFYRMIFRLFLSFPAGS